MYEDDDEPEVEERQPAAQFDPLGLLIIGLRFASGVHDVVSDALNEISDRVAMHVNWKIERRAFAASAGREIEALVAQ